MIRWDSRGFQDSLGFRDPLGVVGFARIREDSKDSLGFPRICLDSKDSLGSPGSRRFARIPRIR